MAYTVRYTVQHNIQLPHSGTNITAKVEILDRDYSGSNTDKKGKTVNAIRHHLEPVDWEQILSGYIQKGRLELDIILSRADLKTIALADDKRFRMKLYLEGIHKWTGGVVPDKTNIRGTDYPEWGTIVAKDLSLLEEPDYGTFNGISNKRYIFALADCFDGAGLGIGIHTYNDWTTDDITTTDDYFNQSFIDEYHLQDFSAFQEGQYAPLNKQEALNHLVPPGYVVRQWNGVWNLIDLSHLAKSGGLARRYEYDKDGVQTGSVDPVDLTKTVDGASNIEMNNPQEQPWTALKKLELKFNHKTSFQHILYKNEYVHTSAGDISVETIKIADTDTRIVRVSGQVEVTTDTNPGSSRTGDAELLIQIEDLELSLSDGSWSTSNGAQQVSVIGSNNTLNGSFSRVSDPIPSSGANEVGESELKVEFRGASVGAETVEEVRWHSLSTRVTYADQVANNATERYNLIQSGDYSKSKEIDTIIFGQGPETDTAALSRSAIKWFDGTYRPLTGFRHDGDTGKQYSEFILTNIMNMQRQHTEAADVDIKGFVEPLDVLDWEGSKWFISGGETLGYDGWPLRVVRLDWNTAGDDEFKEFFEVSDSDAGPSVPAPSSGGASELDDLSDVTIDSPVADEGLFYDGSKFVNTPVPNLDASKITTGQFTDGRISKSSVEQHLGDYAKRTESETITAPWTFSDQLTIAKGSGTSIKQRIALNVSGAGGMDMEAVDTGNFNFIPVVGGAQQSGVTLRYNHSSLRWEINGSQILTGSVASQDLGWSPSTNTVTITDGNNAQISTFGQNITHEGRVDFKGSLEQYRIYNGSGGSDYFSWHFDDATLELRRTDVSVPDTQDIISVDFSSGKITLWGSGSAHPEIAGSDIATEPWANGRFAIRDNTQTISGTWNYTTRPTVNGNDVTDVGDMTIPGEWDFERGISGSYNNTTGNGTDWGANIWGIGHDYTSSGAGTSFTLGNHYGLVWYRDGHTEANSNIGEGLYVYQNGALRAGIGSDGIWIQGDKKLRVEFAGAYTDYLGYGVQMNRNTSYVRNVHHGGSIIFRQEDSSGNNYQARLFGDRLEIEGHASANGALYLKDNGSWSGNVPAGVGKIEANAGHMYIQTPGEESSDSFFVRNPSGTNVFRVRVQSGDTEQDGISYATDHRESSDLRLKSNLKRIKSAREISRYANLYSFTKEGLDEPQIGLIAQDLEKAGYEEIVGWMDHKDYEDGVRTLSGYTLGSIALAGVGELDSEVEQLKSRVKELEAEVKKLRAA